MSKLSHSNRYVRKTAMRVLFLDVDGVLNCALTTDRFNGMMGLDERFLENLSKIVKTSSEKNVTNIVLSSSWRVGEDKDGNAIPKHYKYLEEKLEEHGLSIYDETPAVRYSKDGYSNHRGREIATWLYTHKNEGITGIAILDDVAFDDFRTYHFGPYFVKCIYFSYYGGLIEPLVDKALKTLDKKFYVSYILSGDNGFG